jgi:hypothetical protein
MRAATRPLADDYLRRLERAAGVLPRGEREELLTEIRAHLEAGLAHDPGEAEVRNLLDQLGTPADIVAAAAPTRRPVRRGARESFAVLLLLTGFPPVLGWLVGAGLLLSSPLWTWRDRLLGLLVWPGGIVVALGVPTFTARSGSCAGSGTAVGGPAGTTCTTSGSSVLSLALVVAAVVAPLVVAGYLYWIAGRRSTDPAQ